INALGIDAAYACYVLDDRAGKLDIVNACDTTRSDIPSVTDGTRLARWKRHDHAICICLRRVGRRVALARTITCDAMVIDNEGHRFRTIVALRNMQHVLALFAADCNCSICITGTEWRAGAGDCGTASAAGICAPTSSVGASSRAAARRLCLTTLPWPATTEACPA